MGRRGALKVSPDPGGVSGSGAQVLALCRWYPPAVGGVENYMENIYRSLPGYQVVVLAPGLPGASAYDAASALPSHMRVHRTPGRISADRKLSLLEFAREAWLLATRFESLKHVHCAHVLMAPLAVTLRWRTGAKVAVFAHGSEFTNGRWQRARVRSFNAADVVIANSSVTRDELVSRGVDPAKVAVVTPGVDPVRFAPDAADRERFRRSLGLSPDTVLCVSVGRLHPHAQHKGFDTAVQAVAEVRVRTGVDLQLAIVGDGDDRRRLETIAQQTGAAQAVHFLGRIPDDELVSAYRAGDIYLMASRHEKTERGYTTEGFGLVFLEAAAAGLPVVATAVGGAQHAVVDGRTGLLSATPDVIGVAAALERLVRDSALRREYATAGCQRASGEFAWPTIGSTFAAALQGVES